MVLFKAPSLRPVVAEASARTRRGGWLCPGGPETRHLCPGGSRGHGPPHLLFTGDTLRGRQGSSPSGPGLSPRPSLPDEQAGRPEPSTALCSPAPLSADAPAGVPGPAAPCGITDVLRLLGSSPPWAVTTLARAGVGLRERAWRGVRGPRGAALSDGHRGLLRGQRALCRGPRRDASPRGRAGPEQTPSPWMRTRQCLWTMP